VAAAQSVPVGGRGRPVRPPGRGRYQI
jgi:hypothetical protein